jgi:uncharacterized protein (TIGR03435 family)
MAAYRVEGYQISGPPWLKDDKFTVIANVPEGASKDEFRLMFQNLLIERFNLRLHNESKVARVYSLALGKNGPKPALKLVPVEHKRNEGAAEQSAGRKSSPFQMTDRRGQLTLTAQRMTMFRLVSKKCN